MTKAATIIKLADVQRRILELREERDVLIREAINGGAGVREIARFVGLSAAQVSRIARASGQSLGLIADQEMRRG